jgi:hypothetical protein
MADRGLLRAVDSSVRCNAELTINGGRIILCVCELSVHSPDEQHKSGCTRW